MVDSSEEKINELCKLLLDAGALLMSSGANTARIRLNVMRIANAFGYNAELLVTHRALMLTLYDDEKDYFFSRLKRTSPHGVNFRIVSGISRMSWSIIEENWTLEQVRQELDRLQSLPHYPRWIILLMVSFAGAAFCRLAGGEWVDMLVAGGATCMGLFIRQEATKRLFNSYFCVFLASMVSSLISGFVLKMQIGSHPEYAFATSVLYLIPGIPLINSLSDLLDGNIMNGIVRGVNGLMISFAIALGMLCAIVLYGL